MGEDKSHRGAASQFFVAGELCRRGLVAVLTLGNCPNTDVLVSNKAGTRFAHVQVKTYRPGRDKTVSVGLKAQKPYGPGFFWVLAGIPEADSTAAWEYFVVPAGELSRLVCDNHRCWLEAPGKKGQAHNENKVRTVFIPPAVMDYTKESIERYRDRWDLIVDACADATPSLGPEPDFEELAVDECGVGGTAAERACVVAHSGLPTGADRG